MIENLRHRLRKIWDMLFPVLRQASVKYSVFQNPKALNLH